MKKDIIKVQYSERDCFNGELNESIKTIEFSDIERFQEWQRITQPYKCSIEWIKPLKGFGE